MLANRIFYSGQDIRHIVHELDEQYYIKPQFKSFPFSIDKGKECD